MPQAIPSYINSIGKIETDISINLSRKYGYKNILNIICFGKIINNRTAFYILEKNEINVGFKNLPKSKKNIPFVFLDLKSGTRKLYPNYKELQFLIDDEYKSLMEFTLSKKNNDYYTIDIDYVFKGLNSWKGFEFTTFYMPFKNKYEAERLISKINRRPSWKSIHGARSLKRIVNDCEDLDIDLYMVCANTLGKVGSKLNLAGNCYIFKLSIDQINNLEKGKPPTNGILCPFKEFIEVIENGFK